MSGRASRRCERCGREVSRVNVIGGVLLCDLCYEEGGGRGERPAATNVYWIGVAEATRLVQRHADRGGG